MDAPTTLYIKKKNLYNTYDVCLKYYHGWGPQFNDENKR